MKNNKNNDSVKIYLLIITLLCVVIKVLIFVNYMRCVVKLKVEIDKFARKSI